MAVGISSVQVKLPLAPVCYSNCYRGMLYIVYHALTKGANSLSVLSHDLAPKLVQGEMPNT